MVRSGTATSLTAESAFLAQTNGFMDFKSASANTEDQRDFFRDILAGYQIRPSEAAILVEDESGYGSGIEKSANREKEPIRVFTFPRDIAHLRNAYREAVLASKSDPRTAPSIDFSLKDTDSGEDSIATFSPTQTPLSQNVVITQITSAIRRDGIRIVQMNATNVLDLLFLARVLRRECPDTRILTVNSDLLFVEAAREAPSPGLLAISTYPLSPTLSGPGTCNRA